MKRMEISMRIPFDDINVDTLTNLLLDTIHRSGLTAVM